MDSNLTGSIPGGYSPIRHDTQTKSLTTHTATKAEGTVPGAGPDPALVQWFQQAQTYYQAVTSGQEAQPDPAQWQDFMNQLQWASTTLGQSGWNPGVGGTPGAMSMGGPGGQQSAVPAGATLGVMGNVVYNSPTAKITNSGDPRRQDIWSNDVTIDVPSMSATVTSQVMTDSTLQPNEQVLKIVVHDSATNVDTVYYVHDYADAKVKVNTGAASQHPDASNAAEISFGKYTESSGTSTTHPDASTDGEVTDTTDTGTTTKYAPEFYDETSTVDFFANPGDPGKTDVSVSSYSNNNISVKSDDQVVVVKDQPNPGDVTVRVLHDGGPPDGSEDDYQIKKGYKTININGNPASIHFGSDAGADGTAGVPGDYTGITLNGGTGTTSGTSNVDPDAAVSALEAAAGLTGPNADNQVISVLKASGYTQYDTMDKLKAAIADGSFPPKPMDNNFLKFLTGLDTTLSDDLNTLNDKINNCAPDSEKKSARDALQGELINMLGPLYPNDIIAGTTSTDPTSGGFTISGAKYSWNISGGALNVTAPAGSGGSGVVIDPNLNLDLNFPTFTLPDFPSF